MEKRTVIDVRSIEEFNSGHLEGSINIPLQDVPEKVEEIRLMAPPIILCCKSGYRSDQAMHYLHQFDIDCENGGGWTDLV
jgi:rhodanese-related sulfurtransferase